MSDHRYKCPNCEAVLKTAAALPAGKAVKCPKCQAVFKVPGAAAVTRPAAAAAVTKKPAKPLPPPPADEDDEEREEAEAPKVRKGVKLEAPPADDEGEEEQDEKPAKAKKGKKDKGKKKGAGKKSSLPLLLGVGGGLILLVGGVMGGLYAFGVIGDRSPPKPVVSNSTPSTKKEEFNPQQIAPGDQPLAKVILGKWTAPELAPIEYVADGTYYIYSSKGIAIQGVYKVLNDKEIELSFPGERITGGKEICVVKGDKLGVTDSKGKTLTYQRDGQQAAAQPLDKALLGRWKEVRGETTNEYLSDGTFIQAQFGEVLAVGTYKILNDKDVEFQWTSNKKTDTFKQVHVIKGDQLIWSAEGKRPMVLQRVKEEGGDPPLAKAILGKWKDQYGYSHDYKADGILMYGPGNQLDEEKYKVVNEREIESWYGTKAPLKMTAFVRGKLMFTNDTNGLTLYLTREGVAPKP